MRSAAAEIKHVVTTSPYYVFIVRFIIPVVFYAK